MHTRIPARAIAALAVTAAVSCAPVSRDFGGGGSGGGQTGASSGSTAQSSTGSGTSVSSTGVSSTSASSTTASGTSVSSTGSGPGPNGDAGTDGSTTPVTNACVGAADQAAVTLHGSSLRVDVATCGMNGAGTMASVSACIATRDGLSSPCADCFAAAYYCAITFCLQPCEMNISGADCTTCLSASCDPALVTCTGVPSVANF